MDIDLILREFDISEPIVENKIIEEAPVLRINPFGIEKKFLKFLRKADTWEVSCMAKLYGDIHPVSCSYTYDNRLSILPYKGPTLTEGKLVPHNENYLIKKIHHSKTTNYYILELDKAVWFI